MHAQHLLALAIDMPFMTEEYLRFFIAKRRHLVTSGKLLEISVTEKEKRLFRHVNNASDVDATIAGG